MNLDLRSPVLRRLLLSTLLLAAVTHAAAGAAAEVQFWFVRHAESEINLDSLPHSVPDEGVSYPLTRAGVEQAIALADELKDTRVVGIYSSPRLRAIQTADAIAFRQRTPVAIAPEVVEIALGIPIDAPDYRQSYRELVTKWVVERDLGARLGDGETLAEAQRRFLPFVRELMNRHIDDSGVVVVVSHGAALGVLVPMLAPNVPADLVLKHPLSNTGIIKTQLRDGRLFCIEWAGLSPPDFATPAPATQQIQAR